MSSISKKQQAIIYIICSAFFFALMNMFVRMSGDLPSIQKSFFRNLVAFFFRIDIILLVLKMIFPSEKKSACLYWQIIFRHAGYIPRNLYAVDHFSASAYDASHFK